MPHIEPIKSKLEQAKLAGFFYQHSPELLVFQEPLNDDGSMLNVFVQHELSADQIGLQFGLRCRDQQLSFLIGVTHSNQDRSYEIGAGNLKAEQKAFNLMYAFYNYPKGFYLVDVPLNATTAELHQAIETQLFSQEKLDFLNTAIKTNPIGTQVTWMKAHILQQALDMKVRIQTALL
ncbi:hypothetical protein [Acinetobacter sp. YH12211]|uniref:hypothetical protein n=1 Tax=Acinetobacter sp. YH12211 TaxID=2601147 RepID=UPI0015D16938|nr:hypothetical protein [Acinetobacter sp. YH12211]